jgi:radical SAM protein with 4Fe4S-binding SPASM domain
MMQPQTNVKFDKPTFDRIKRTIRNMSVGRRMVQDDPGFATELPDEIGIQLTNRCNLRCKHCFQWNETGFHNQFESTLQKADLEPDLLQKILFETRDVKSNLYLWGGEPLSYRYLDELSFMLEKDPRWSVFCTNGVETGKNMESLLRMSSSLAMLISLEGFEKENDAIRGAGVYRKVTGNIRELLDLKEKGLFKGEVSVNCVINTGMIGRYYELAEEFESMGINSLYFCFPWYIPHPTAEKMDDFFSDKFGWLRTLDTDQPRSWYSYTYQLPEEVTPALLDDLKRIRSRKWNMRLRLQPALELDEVKGFLTGLEVPGQNKSQCMGIRNRMNIMPDGKVTVCKLFPEFEIGDLNKQDVQGIWNSPDFNRVRKILSGGLMPVCSKCILLYLHGV